MVVFKSIKVTEDIHAKLTQLGCKNDTYNDIISRLISEHESNVDPEPITDEEEKYLEYMVQKIEQGDLSDFETLTLENGEII